MVQGDFWNKLKQRLREVSTAAADFTEEQALIGKLKFDILNLTRKIERKQREIGQRVCELFNESPRPDVFEDGDIVRLIAEIDELNKQTEQKRNEISKVADQVRSKRSKAEAEEAVKPPPPKKPEPYVKPPTAKPKAAKPAAKKKTTSTKKKPPAAAKTVRKPSQKKTKPSTDKGTSAGKKDVKPEEK